MNIEDFIKDAAKNLGAGESQVRSATGGLLGVIKEKAGAGDFQALLAKVPGADALLKSAPAAAAPSKGVGGLLGGLGGAGGIGGMAASLLGKEAGGVAGVLGALTGSGLDLGKLTSLVPLFSKFLQQSAGADLSKKLLDKVPELKSLAR